MRELEWDNDESDRNTDWEEEDEEEEETAIEKGDASITICETTLPAGTLAAKCGRRIGNWSMKKAAFYWNDEATLWFI